MELVFTLYSHLFQILYNRFTVYVLLAVMSVTAIIFRKKFANFITTLFAKDSLLDYLVFVFGHPFCILYPKPYAITNSFFGLYAFFFILYTLFLFSQYIILHFVNKKITINNYIKVKLHDNANILLIVYGILQNLMVTFIISNEQMSVNIAALIIWAGITILPVIFALIYYLSYIKNFIKGTQKLLGIKP